MVFSDWLLPLRRTVLRMTPAGSRINTSLPSVTTPYSIVWIHHVFIYLLVRLWTRELFLLSGYSEWPSYELTRFWGDVYFHWSWIITWFYFFIICTFQLFCNRHCLAQLKRLKRGIPRVWVNINYWGSLSVKQKSRLAGSSFTLGGTHRHALWLGFGGF